MIRLAALSLLVGLLVASPGWAARPLSLTEAVERAIAQNPQLRAAERRIEAARAREVQAAAWPNPNVSLLVDQVPLPQPIEGNYMAGLSQPLLLGGQREARIELAKLDSTLAELDRDVFRRELTAKVKDAYAFLLYEEEALRLARQDDQAAQALLKATQDRYRAGEVARVEVLRSEIERNRTQREVAAAEGRVSQARGRLNVLLGQEAQAPIAVEALPAPSAKNLPAAGPLVAIAMCARPELRQAEIVIQRESLQRRLAQAGLWTGTEATIAAGVVGGRPGFSTSLSLPVPLYRQQGEVAEAEANRARAEAERDALRHAITLEIEQSLRDAAIAADQVQRFRRSYLPQAEQLADNAQRRFRVGEGSGIEVVEAIHALRETRIAHQQAILEYRRALTGLERALGQAMPSASETSP